MAVLLCCFCLQSTPDQRLHQSLLSQTKSAQDIRQAVAEFTRQTYMAALDGEAILSRSERLHLCNNCGSLLNSWNKLRVQLPEVQQKLAERLAGVHPPIGESSIPRAGHSHEPSTTSTTRQQSLQHESCLRRQVQEIKRQGKDVCLCKKL